MTEISPILSIVIPVFNQVQLTRESLATILENTRPGSYEILVVNNASTDETSAYLRSCGIACLKQIENSTNMGFGFACNQGARATRAEYLVFLNNDTKTLPQWVEPCIEHFREDPEIGIVGSKLLYPDGTIQHGGVEFMLIQNPPILFPLHRFRYLNSNDPQANQCTEVHGITGACLFIPRELFWKVGGFDESYGMYFEDVDLNMKIHALGKKIVYEPRSVVIHFESKSARDPQTNQQQFSRAANIFYSKWETRLASILKPCRPYSTPC